MDLKEFFTFEFITLCNDFVVACEVEEKSHKIYQSSHLILIDQVTRCSFELFPEEIRPFSVCIDFVWPFFRHITGNKFCVVVYVCVCVCELSSFGIRVDTQPQIQTNANWYQKTRTNITVNRTNRAWPEISHHLVSIKKTHTQREQKAIEHEMLREKSLFQQTATLWHSCVYISFFLVVFFTCVSLIISIHIIISRLSIIFSQPSINSRCHSHYTALASSFHSFSFASLAEGFHLRAHNVAATRPFSVVNFFRCEQFRSDKFILLVILLPKRMYGRIADLFLFFIHPLRLILSHTMQRNMYAMGWSLSNEWHWERRSVESKSEHNGRPVGVDWNIEINYEESVILGNLALACDAIM